MASTKYEERNNYLTRELERQRRIELLHQYFKPEPGQIIMGRQIFSAGAKRMWFQFGRDSGKSFGLSYCMVRFASIFPKSYCTHVFPERSQAQKTLWDSGYLRDKIPPEFWLEGDEDKTFNKTELLTKLDNGSRIQLFGADSPDTTIRGPKPDFCGFDEFRDFRPGVYDIMEPNLLGKPLVIVSTPPDTEGEYTELQKVFKEEQKAGNSRYFYIELPTYVASSRYAPGGPKHEELMDTKRLLFKRGEAAKWKREYEAKFIPGGVGSVFKNYQKNKRHIERDPSFCKMALAGKHQKLEWWCIADPSQNGTFAVLYIALDRTAGRFWILGEEAVSDNADTGSLDMWALMKRGMASHHPHLHRWRVVYDEAAAWFYNDLERHGVFNQEGQPEVEPTQKSLEDKSDQMSLLKDIFSIRDRCHISRACEKCIHQIENYVTNKKGEYHKDQPDDFIDDLRYFLAASQFQPFETPEDAVEEDLEPETLEEREKQRASSENAMTGDEDYYESSDEHGSEDEFPYQDEDFL